MSERETPRGPAAERLDRLVARAGLAICWEQVWPVTAMLLTLLGFFVAISFLGLWLETPRWGRMLGVALFGVLALGTLATLARFRAPTRAQKLARLDRDSGLPHRPATAMEDQLANANEDPATQALWALHRARMERAAQALTLRLPSPRLVERDRYALRALALLAVVATAFVAGPEKYARVLAAFDWRAEGALSAGYRLDAWVDPPAYTGKPPVILTLRDEASAKASRAVQAPVGSTIVVRSSEASHVSVEIAGGLEVAKADESAAKGKAAATDTELRWTLKGDGKLVLKRFGSVISAFDLTSVPDRAPVISLNGEARRNSRGSLTLGYKIVDDYGVTGAEANFAKPVLAGKPVTGRTLAEAPKMGLALPAGSGGLGEAETTADLSEHPWAGANVTMTLSAKDEGGNEGMSGPVEITLPQRPFVKPLARALVEQRRNLVLAPDTKGRVLSSIKALMIAPDQFGVTAGIYLGFHNIANRLTRARKDADLLGVADLMWEMALRIEDGGLSDAERDLRAAQQELRDALNRGAPQDEISKLMDQMRAALDKFLNELAQQAQREGRDQEPQSRADNDNSRTITSQDLQSLLDRIEEMMRNGQMAEAQKMMEQLQNLLENLRSAQRQRGTDPMAREMNKALDELDQMTRDQQELRDNTFRNEEKKQRRNQAQRQRDRNQQGQQQRQPGQQGQQGDQDEGDEDQDSAENEGEQSLQQRQEALRQRLDQLQRRMKELGMKGDQNLDDAEGAMKEAEGELGKGQQGRGKAVDAQGRALESLRKGGQAMAQQMQPSPGEENGPGDPNGPMRQGRAGNPDPLGRESHDKRDNSRALYDPLGTPAAQRAQKVLEELRRRLSDPARPRDELDYLERLLKRY